ncbi:MAG: NYN domain-containing protein [Sedimentisphaerales bacterium]|nr:NYN domain-containing protein [Sedimentisphaerales bacterium]
MYIIDGHNLLHAVIKIDDVSGTINDVKLCRIIDYYLQLTGQKGELVFDGTGPRDKEAFGDFGNLEVFFAGTRSDADSVIEDKIKADSAPKRLIIVSSDRRIRKAARAKKAQAVKSEEFWNNLTKQLNKKRHVPEPSAKRQGLSDSETKKWLEIFGIE